MRKTSAYITVALILVVAAAVISIRLFARNGARETEAQDPANGIHAPVTETPAPTPAGGLPDPVILTPPPADATVEPVLPTGTPVVPEEETPPPAAVTAQPILANASGSFSSDTGTYLNMLVEWRVYTDDAGAAKLDVTLSATHYSLRIDEQMGGLELNVNGQVYTAATPAIRYDGKGFVTTPMHTFTVDAPVGAMRISATWHYLGSYSGKTLNDITASDTYYPS
ncbi:MAG: hypothetical protein IJ705_00295 [Oscillospiraceae bacterium]|nr:hypothetical protein [Oscillospiraceae bacterium]